MRTDTAESSFDVAVIGFGCRLPGAPDAEQFWSNLAEGVESITRFTEEELIAAGVPRERLLNPNYVRAKGTISDVEYFDHEFFGMESARAEVTDPQHRMFLEFAWQVLESAGYQGDPVDKRIGLYAGAAFNTYQLNNLRYADPRYSRQFNSIDLLIAADKDFLTTHTSYQLGLAGPSVCVQTACSTSLVAVHQAVQALLAGDCELALAGAITVYCPQTKGYVYEPGNLVSPDGHVRPFDARGQGTVYSSGMGLLVLKRLEDAIQQNDTIHAIIKGTAVNNDGGRKASFKAPSEDAIAEVAAMALEVSGVDPKTIGYVEANGSGTSWGDPIEIAALARAYRGADQSGRIRIGSVKGNVGHLNVTAGMAGLIKTMLALKHGKIPPSINYTAPNPAIDFDRTPFYVGTRLEDWHKDKGEPRRAAVNSYGVGGTNAHVILEAPPPLPVEPVRRRRHLVVLSAKTPTALDRMTSALRDHIERHADESLPDMAYTLQVGRRSFQYRRYVVAGSADDLRKQLVDPLEVTYEQSRPAVVFLFGDSAAGLRESARRLYAEEPLYRHALGSSAAAFARVTGLDLLEVLSITDAEASLDRGVSSSAAVAVVHALAQTWHALGIVPSAALGIGNGLLAAAAAVGATGLDDAMHVALARGRGAPLPERTAWTADGTVELCSASTGAQVTSVEDLLAGSESGLSDEAVAEWVSRQKETVFVEVGMPGVLRTPPTDVDQMLVSTLAPDGEDALDVFLRAVGELWARSAAVTWDEMHGGERRRRIPLPTYSFERIRCWIDLPTRKQESPLDVAM